MDTATLSESFEADAADRLRALLAANGVHSPAAASAALAGEQLELLKPYFMMPTRAGIVSGPRAAVKPGTILFVISDGRRVAASYFIPSCTAAEMFAEGAAEMLEGTPPRRLGQRDRRRDDHDPRRSRRRPRGSPRSAD